MLNADASYFISGLMVVILYLIAISEVTWVSGSLSHWSDSSSDGGVDDLRF